MNKFKTYDEGWGKLISRMNDGYKVMLYHRLSIIFKTNNLIVLYRKDFDDYHVFPIRTGIFNKLGTGNKEWHTIKIGNSFKLESVLYVDERKQTFSLSSGMEIDEKIVNNVKDVKQYIAKELI